MTEGEFLYELLRKHFRETYVGHAENPSWEKIGKDPELSEHSTWEAIAADFTQHVEGRRLP